MIYLDSLVGCGAVCSRLFFRLFCQENKNSGDAASVYGRIIPITSMRATGKTNNTELMPLEFDER